MDIQLIQQLISTVGFPIFTSIYFMTSMKKVLDSNTQALVQVQMILAQSKENTK